MEVTYLVMKGRGYWFRCRMMAVPVRIVVMTNRTMAHQNRNLQHF